MVGLSLILLCELLLLLDVRWRDGVIVSAGPVPEPAGPLQALARLVAIDMTPLVWTGFLLTMDGLLMPFNQSPARQRPVRFAFCFLTSILIWLYFDWINFSYMDAWAYHGLPENLLHRWAGYALAFGAICPAMFMTAQLLQSAFLQDLRGRPVRLPPATHFVLVLIGAVFLIFPMLVRDPIGNLTLWLGVIALLDPVNHQFGAPSILRDWEQGRWGRTLALMLGGLICGLLWEFWNYWAVAKWTYDLPFLGALEHTRYFEMPVLGLAGFPFFAIECWVAFQTLVLLAQRLRLRRQIEPLAEDNIL